MRSASRCWTHVLWIGVVGWMAAAGAAEAQLPESFENLQVLPKDIGQGALIDTMRSFSSGLGVRCQHCHVGEEGQPLTSFDFVSDEKEAKRVARQMMRMTRAINETYLPRSGRSQDQLLNVSCITCHRSRQRPESLEDNLRRELAARGTDAAIAAYRQLRERYYGRQAFDFGESSLLRLAEGLAMENPASAMPFLKLNLEHFPESVRTWVGIGSLHFELGDNAAAVTAFEKALELRPGTGHIEQLLENAKARMAEPSASGDGS